MEVGGSWINSTGGVFEPKLDEPVVGKARCLTIFRGKRGVSWRLKDEKGFMLWRTHRLAGDNRVLIVLVRVLGVIQILDVAHSTQVVQAMEGSMLG